jgi:hypothetical protein
MEAPESRAEQRLLSHCAGLRCWLDRDDEPRPAAVRARLRRVLGERTSSLLLDGLATGLS